MFKPIRAVFAAALFTIATYGLAAEMRGDHPDTYVVKRGDTLWDIAGKFLQKPWLWPEIWQANPQISNPHLIYPGDVISLAYLNRVGVEPGPREEAPINAIPLADVEAFLKDLSVVDSVEGMPYVVGLEEDRLRGAQGQAIYAAGLDSAQPGERYTVVRPMQRYTRLDRTNCCDLFHSDDLDFRGKRHHIDFENAWTNAVTPDNGSELLGYELVKLTNATVSRGVVDGVEVVTLVVDDAGREIRVGDRLVPVQAQPYDLQFFPHAPAQTLEYGRARILAVADTLKHGGRRDVVALSVGARDGVDNGTVFSSWREGSNAVDRVKVGDDRSEYLVGDASRARLPDEFAGHIMVFRTFDKVSYGLVMDGIRPIKVGHHLKHPDAAY
ncbi:LysM peptidoglycan-binding domain-containing protein [Marilutibacter chinensis]|uniref:LysM peptidoglycan-binding domain-containing protein n=1 Tax=Marilutibacter chinensis TaxID=2912247 RepID=A0ABS9HRL3_9GAMM|nr:LysM peptidoglycan-binding domain-containing protein [Lysobacter chinensis]MCF7221564.1 LysM peptidoglycan-binding domain-containing protein [Lysobacter chinensis]